MQKDYIDSGTRTEPPVKGTQRRSRKTLCVIQERPDAATAFVLVLAGYGDAFAAVELGRGMGPDYILIALQPPDDDTQFAKVRTARNLAGLYLEKLKELRPQGPYIIGGYSAGALLALEMAQQLRAQREEVPLLVLLDPLFLRYSRLEQVSYGALKELVERTECFARGFRQHNILSAMIQDKGLERHLQALQNYEPKPYAGRIVLVESKWSRFLRPPTFMAGWKKIATRGLERYRSQGDHHTFVRPPHAGKLGRQLVDWIGRVTQGNRG